MTVASLVVPPAAEQPVPGPTPFPNLVTSSMAHRQAVLGAQVLLHHVDLRLAQSAVEDQRFGEAGAADAAALDTASRFP